MPLAVQLEYNNITMSSVPPNLSRLNMESKSDELESKRNIELIPVLFFPYCDYINRFQSYLVRNEEGAASQACQ